MSKLTYIKEGPDKKGRTHIIEGVPGDKNVFSVTRFICEVQPQETEKETQEVADLLVEKLNKD